MKMEAETTEDLRQLDRASILHPFTPLRQFASGESGGPRIITGGEGIRIRDRDGNELIDAFAGLYCVNVGYGRREIAEAIHSEALKLAYYHAYAGHSNEPAIRLSQRVLAMTPGRMQRIYYGLSGSDANETHVKLVWYYNNVLGRPKKKKIISRWRGYHGGTVLAGSLTGLEVFHRAFDLPQGPVLHTGTPHYYWNAQAGETEREFSHRRAKELQDLIEREGPDTIAAFIGEPVLGTGGLIPPPEGYWEEIQHVLKRYDVLLIADEVICGFGRLGTPFGSHFYGMEPDLITVAKGLTSAYLPLSAAIVGEKVYRVMEDGADRVGAFSHGYTYSGHPIGAAAANAVLDIVEREDLAGKARDTGAYLQTRLKAAFAQLPIVGEVRGVGMLAAIEFVADREKKARFDVALKVGPRVSKAARVLGLIARAMPHGDILGFAPPLIATRADVDEIVAIAEKAVRQVMDEIAA